MFYGVFKSIRIAAGHTLGGLLFRQFLTANSPPPPVRVEIPFGFKGVWQLNANRSDCACAENQSEKARRLIPSEPRRNQYAWKSQSLFKRLKIP
jgi:hypothetical protein